MSTENLLLSLRRTHLLITIVTLATGLIVLESSRRPLYSRALLFLEAVDECDFSIWDSQRGHELAKYERQIKTKLRTILGELGMSGYTLEVNPTLDWDYRAGHILGPQLTLEKLQEVWTEGRDFGGDFFDVDESPLRQAIIDARANMPSAAPIVLSIEAYPLDEPYYRVGFEAAYSLGNSLILRRKVPYRPVPGKTVGAWMEEEGGSCLYVVKSMEARALPEEVGRLYADLEGRNLDDMLRILRGKLDEVAEIDIAGVRFGHHATTRTLLAALGLTLLFMAAMLWELFRVSGELVDGYQLGWLGIYFNPLARFVTLATLVGIPASLAVLLGSGRIGSFGAYGQQDVLPMTIVGSVIILLEVLVVLTLLLALWRVTRGSSDHSEGEHEEEESPE